MNRILLSANLHAFSISGWPLMCADWQVMEQYMLHKFNVSCISWVCYSNCRHSVANVAFQYNLLHLSRHLIMHACIANIWKYEIGNWSQRKSKTLYFKCIISRQPKFVSSGLGSGVMLSMMIYWTAKVVAIIFEAMNNRKSVMNHFRDKTMDRRIITLTLTPLDKADHGIKYMYHTWFESKIQSEKWINICRK